MTQKETRKPERKYNKKKKEIQILYDVACMQSLKKMIQMNLFTKQKETHRLRERTYGHQRGRGGG